MNETNPSLWEIIPLWISALSTVGILIQIYLIISNNKKDHERSRRENAIELLLKWTEHLDARNSLARKLLEILEDTQVRSIANQSSFQIPTDPPVFKEYLYSIFPNESNKDQKESQERTILVSAEQSTQLRWLVLSYLNKLEAILCSWLYSVSDKDLLESQFQYLFSETQGHSALQKFRMYSGGADAFPAIEAFSIKIKQRNEKKVLSKEIIA